MLPPIALQRLRAYEGPHIYGPWTGVRLRARCDSDRALRLRAAIKDGAQFVGLFVAYLEVTASADGAGYTPPASVTTDPPRLGADPAAYGVEGIGPPGRGGASPSNVWPRHSPVSGRNPP